MIARSLFKKFIFIHIPKTAGTSIATTISRNWKFRTSFDPYVHATAQEMVNRLGDKFHKNYSFTFVRNPWDRLHSLYHFICQKKLNYAKGEHWDQDLLKKRGFKAWLLEDDFWPPYTKNKGPSSQKRNQTYFIQNSNKEIIVKDIFYYERLDADLLKLSKKLGINFTDLMKSKTTKRSDYRDDYCGETIDFVYKYHAEDIKNFGYKFE